MINLFLCLLYLHSCSTALTFGPRGLVEPLRLDFSVHNQEHSVSSNLRKRQNGTMVGKMNSLESLFLVNITIGSPGQQVTVKLDTSEGDLWVTDTNATCVPIPDNPYAKGTDFCKSAGVYNFSLSETAKNKSSVGPFAMVDSIDYFAYGSYVQDSFEISSVRIPDVIFGLVNASTSFYGSFGIGPPELEVVYSTVPQVSRSYMNFPMRLKAEGMIYKAAYSLYFDDSQAAAGTVLFGGVDHKKYTGQLQTVPLIPITTDPIEGTILFGIMLNSMSLVSPRGELLISQAPFIVIPDTLSPYSMLPRPIIANMVKGLRGKIAAQDGYLIHIVDCMYQQLDISLTFNFSGNNISIPISAFIVREKNKCFLSVSSSETFFLGNNFLTQVYSVFNNDDHELSLASVAYSNEEDIETIISAVPSAIRAANYSITATPSILDITSQKTGMLPSGNTISKSSKSYPVGLFLLVALSLSFIAHF